MVFRRIKNVMHRQRQLHNPKIRGQVPAVLTQNRDHLLPNFLGKRLQLLNRQLLYILRTLNRIKNTCRHDSPKTR